jgi:hypothetical protein
MSPYYCIPENYFDIVEPLFMNIYKTYDEKEYVFSGVLNSNCQHFYLVFDRNDEHKLPYAVEFQLSDESINCRQYQLMNLLDKDYEYDHLFVQMEDVKLSKLYMIDVSPSFPFPVDISGKILLLNKDF